MATAATPSDIIGSSSCPQCGQELTKVGNFWICPEHGQVTTEQQFKALRIFISYGHDSNEVLVNRIREDLEKRGHDVWFDKNEIKSGDDWRREITEGITNSHKFLSFLSKHSTRDPGVCLDEISIAIGVKGGNIQTILVENEQDVKVPSSISHIQWLDMRDWKQQRDTGEVEWEEWYKLKFSEIIRVIESDESQRFSGEIETLKDNLKPISSEIRISTLLEKKFFGRKWLLQEVEQWCSSQDRTSRIFWIVGNAGVGKSSFAAHLTHFGRDKVIAVQFCEWDKPDYRNSQRIICNLAFQLATRLPDYRKLLLLLPEISKLNQKVDPDDLFVYLLANPLRSLIRGGRERYLIVIDALDEAGESGHNEFVEMLARNIPQLPDWIGIILTSRPEETVNTPLQGLKPFIIDARTDANREDIREYIHYRLFTLLDQYPNENQVVDQILEKSDGVFLFVEHVCNDLQQGNLSLDRLNQFPQGLGGILFQFFNRQFPETEKFQEEVRPALRAILAAREPLPTKILQQLFNWQEEELRKFIQTLGSLFQVTIQSRVETIRPYHKSIADWLTDIAKSGAYFVSIAEGNKLLADYCWQSFINNIDAMTRYEVRFAAYHLESAGRNNDATKLRQDKSFYKRFLEVEIESSKSDNFRLNLQQVDLENQLQVHLNSMRDQPRWHPVPANYQKRLGPRDDYADLYLFPCCKKYVITDWEPPSQYRDDGCEDLPS